MIDAVAVADVVVDFVVAGFVCVSDVDLEHFDCHFHHNSPRHFRARNHHHILRFLISSSYRHLLKCVFHLLHEQIKLIFEFYLSKNGIL